MKKISVLIGLFFLFNVLVHAQTEMSLEGAINYALEHNQEIKRAHLNVADAEAQIIENRSIGLPQLNGEATFDRYLQVPVSTLPDAFQEVIKLGNGGELPPDFSPQISFILKNSFSAGLYLRSMVFDGSFFTGLKAARAYQRFAIDELNDKQEGIKNQVIEAYIPILIIRESLSLIEKNIANTEKLYHETKRTYEEGFVEQLDVDRLALTLSNLKTEKDNFVRQEKQALNLLKLAIGYPVKQTLIITEDIESLLTEATVEDLTGTYNYLDRTSYRVAETGLQLSALNVEYNKSLYLPSVFFNARYTQTFQGDRLFREDPNSFWAPNFVVGLSLNVPILDGFGKGAKIERQQIAYEIAQTQRDELRQLIDVEIDNGRRQYEGATERLNNQKENLTLAEKIYKTTQIKYKEGVGTSLELNQAERDLFATQRNYTQALYDVLVAKMNLNKVLGK